MRYADIKTRVRCSSCNKIGAIRAQRVDPRNFHLHYRLLCTACQRRLGYSRPDFGGATGFTR